MTKTSGEALFTPLVKSLPATLPFVGPEAIERQQGRPIAARLGANESAFGPSPKALAAMADAVEGNWMYSDPENWDLRQAIAAHHGVTADNVVVGEGIDGLLELTVQMLVAPGEVVVTSDGAYPTFNFHVAQHGGALVKVPYRDDKEDLEALCAAAAKHTAKILYVSNPDNPMGSWWAAAALEQLIDNLPSGCLMCLDEAYSELGPKDCAPPIDVSNPYVLRYRTFSKAYGMAGARIGYALGASEIIAAFEKIRNHYGINRVGQIGALAAIKDQDYVRAVVKKISHSRQRIADFAVSHGLKPLPSATNFVAIDCGRDGAFARSIRKGLIERGVFVRQPGVAPLDRCIRVSAGIEGDLAIFDAALGETLAGLR